MGKRAPRVRSIVGSFSRLPELPYDAGSVASKACHLPLVAARAPPGALGEDAQNDNKLATIPSGPGVVGQAWPWPRFDVPALPLHDAPSDSPAR
jgi:hypothetical protein